MSKLITFVMCLVMVFAYAPAPVVSPDGVSFDPNDYPYDVMLAKRIPLGNTYSGEIDIAEPDGDDITITASGINLSSPDITVNGVAKEYTYPFTYQANGVGLHDITVSVNDAEGLSDNRIMLFYVYENQGPVITGCR